METAIDFRRERQETLTVDRAHELLNLDPTTGILTWRIPRPKCSVGKRAGFVCKRSGYRKIKLDRILYTEHRVIFLMHRGFWPPDEIDHREPQRSENGIDNIRPATRSQNGANSRLRSDNTSGFKGVRFHKRAKKWNARLHVRGAEKHLGLFEDIEEAARAYDTAAREHFGEFARTNF